jgi:hypothetical protein
MRKVPSAAIFGLTANLALALCGRAQQAPSQFHRQEQEAMPHSGALVGLSNGQTLWIAPVEGKIRIISTGDYVIPRKDGFWRVRPEVKWAPAEGVAVPEAKKNDPATAGVPPGAGRLWAVPLKKGRDAAPWKDAAPQESESPVAKDDLQMQEQESDKSLMDRMEEEASESLKQELTFLGPDYISLYQTQTVISSGGGTGASEMYSVLKITDGPAVDGRPGEWLMVQRDALSIPDAVGAKDLEACIDPDNKDEFKDEDFLKNAQEVTYGIKRSRQRWIYGWILGYATGAARGYHTECPVSILPPKNIVGYDQMFPEWKAIAAVYPKAEDAFSSPTQDLILVIAENHLIVASLHEGRVGKPLAQMEISGKPAMVQWATGKYVVGWSKELSPYFSSVSTERR